MIRSRTVDKIRVRTARYYIFIPDNQPPEEQEQKGAGRYPKAVFLRSSQDGQEPTHETGSRSSHKSAGVSGVEHIGRCGKLALWAYPETRVTGRHLLVEERPQQSLVGSHPPKGCEVVAELSLDWVEDISNSFHTGPEGTRITSPLSLPVP